MIKHQSKLIFILLVPLLLFGCFSSVDSSHLSVHMIDVGQGDSFLIQTPEGVTMLIDGGSPLYSDRVVSYLKRQRVSQIDYLVATHPHADHIGGLIAVMETFSVNQVILPTVTHDSRLYTSFMKAIKKSDAETFRVRQTSRHSIDKDIAFKILHTGVDYGSNLNNWSVVIRLDYEEMSFLFTGDLEAPAEKDLLNLFPVSQLSAEVLKVGHHGSSTSTTEPFLSAVSPQVALISSGENNAYGHPSDDVISRLEDKNIWIYRTDLQGNIVIYSDGQKVWSHQAPFNLGPVSSSGITTTHYCFFVNQSCLFITYTVPFQKQAV
ncbi:MAG: MBL fold metallo-hydrolase [Tindallia sp. MSAO_Bac2]|nr:MAG: MBL fold metallo-hydrolase [Tindallia sp. MSAO_Bac2]